MAYYAPIRRSPKVSILDVVPLRLWLKPLCGLVLEQNLPFQKIAGFLMTLNFCELSRPRDLPPQPLPEPYVNLSIHTAPIV
jgi:hypothetical protein